MATLGTTRRALYLASIAVLLGTAALAQTPCDEPREFLGSPTWQAFAHTIETHYLAPRNLSVADLSPRQLAKVLGHAMARQAHHAGDDPERRARFACLERAAAAALEEGFVFFSSVTGSVPTANGIRDLITALSDASRGFYDDEVLALTGVSADEDLASVLSISPPSDGSEPSVPALPSVSGAASGPSDEPIPCRFRIDPALYTDAKPQYEWALVRQPWRGGYYYDTWGIDPSWPQDHPKRVSNRLDPDQDLVVTGTKQDVLRRIESLQARCK